MHGAPLVHVVGRPAERVARVPPAHLVVPPDPDRRARVAHAVEQTTGECGVVGGVECAAIVARLDAQVERDGRGRPWVGIEDRARLGGGPLEGAHDAHGRGAWDVAAGCAHPIPRESRRQAVEPLEQRPRGRLAHEQVVVVGVLFAADRGNRHAQGQPQPGQLEQRLGLGLRQLVLADVAARDGAEGLDRIP